LVVRRREADAEMVPKIPSGCCMLVKQPFRCQFITLNAVALKQKQIESDVQITHFNLHDKLKFRCTCFKLPLSAI
jgi:hypothetical protein